MELLRTPTIAIIGLGYVGLPLAVAFGKHYPTIGFDIKSARIQELQHGKDHTQEVSIEELGQAIYLQYTDNLADLYTANVFIITVPTPIDEYKHPDLSLLKLATKSVATLLKSNDIVIYESTVYPGATEEECVPILEKVSGLTFNLNFFVGYSPERINPGDHNHRLANIVKVTSGSTPITADFVDRLYQSIIPAGTHKASSIKVAEAAKVIENTQRDINIALINELAIIFNRMGIDSEAVLQAASTKWNFQPFRPGLVGGHCIGVDPYYLTHKAQSLGYTPEIILAGRRINDDMGTYVAGQLIKAMIKHGIQSERAKVLVMGLTFKENCPDLRNTKVIDIIKELQDYNIQVDTYDPWACPEEALHEYGISLLPMLVKNRYAAIILAVAHQQFQDMGVNTIRQLGQKNHILYDLKYIFPMESTDLRL